MSLTADWLDAIDGTNALAATIDFSRHGSAEQIDPLEARSVAFEEAGPVREFVSWPGKRNFEGRLWLSSTSQHVPFESFWERAFLATLDRTGDAVTVSSQPMWIRWRSPKRSHVPDYFVRRGDGSGLLVDVRPKELIGAEDAAKFELTRRLAAALGWSYLVFDALPGATQDNLRFLLRFRDPAWLEGVDVASLALTGSMTLGRLAAILDDVARSGLGAAYALVWSGAAKANLERPLSMSTIVDFGAGS
ncbi:TnsA-like heteromeric transposase endonuclease subunit [Microbacterium sp.]|uniref:TnsA-like heteromeric transposase endonuclease subunit n=1 Tax=Microbacterium sp. TaxID=51671 RepID=UPI003C720D0A